VTAASTTAGSLAAGGSRASADRWFLRLAILPAALVLVGVGVVPLLYAGWLSLHDYDLVRPPQIFIGLENYQALLSDGRFQYSMGFTFAFAFAATSIELVVGFLVAWLLADRQVPGALSSASRTLMLIPYMVAPVVMAYIFKTLIYDANFGYLSDALVRLGQPPFIMFEGYWKPILALLFMDVVLRTPFVVLILYAGITTVSQEQLEAASVDGANLRQRIVRIVLPVLRPILVVAFVFRFMDALKIFDEIWVITGGGPGRTTESLSVFASKTAFTQFKMGYATASSLVFTLAVLAITVVILRGTRFQVEE
jgi:multiple sugar transport system permease protein